jgi:hypothetical protein
MSRAAPTDKGHEGRRLVADAYIGTMPPGLQPPELDVVVTLIGMGGPFGLAIRQETVAAIVTRWPDLDRMYTAKVVRDLCRGTCAVSDGWRTRLEALAESNNNLQEQK